jgi:hypothetical protein
MASEEIQISDMIEPTAVELARGGFHPEMKIMTADGPQAVSYLSPGTNVYALNPSTEVVQPKPVSNVEYISDVDTGIEINTRRSKRQVAPEHRIPFQTKSISRTRFTSVEKLSEKEYYSFGNSR